MRFALKQHGVEIDFLEEVAHDKLARCVRIEVEGCTQLSSKVFWEAVKKWTIKGV